MSLQQQFDTTLEFSSEDLNKDMPPTGQTQVLVPQESAVQEALARLNHKHAVQLAEAEDDAGDVADTVAEVRDRMDEANREGGLSVESLLFAQIALEAGYRRLGQSLPQDVVSEENFPALDEKVIVDLEALDVSLEGMASVLRNVAKKTASTLLRQLAPISTVVKHHRKKLRHLVDRARSLKGTKVPAFTVELSHDWGTQVTKDPAKELDSALKPLTYLVKDFLRRACDDYVDNSKAIDSLTFKDADSFMKSYNALKGKWKDPRSKLSESQLKHEYPGGFVLFKDRPVRYRGGNDTAKYLDRFAHLNYPTRIGFNTRSLAASESGTCKGMTPEEIIRVGSALLATGEDFGGWNSFIAKQPAVSAAIALLIASPLGLASGAAVVGASMAIGYGGHAVATRLGYERIGGTLKKVKRQHRSEITALRSAIKTSRELMYHVGYDCGAALSFCMYLFRDVASESLKVYQDKVTTEARKEDAPKLQTGTIVTYGDKVKAKIIRVATQSFKHDGKLYHATEENPKCLVKDEGNGHLSVQKASELTPIA